MSQDDSTAHSGVEAGLRILVTGGAGFIGSHLVETLVGRGDEVTVLDDLSNGSLENLKAIQGQFSFRKADVSNPIPSGGFNTIYHLACWPRSRSFDSPLKDVEVNVKGMVNVLELARKDNASVIFSSNSGIYSTEKVPIDESCPDDPKSPYDLDKLTAEKYCKLYSTLYDVQSVILRFATVYGPRQRVTEEWRPVVMTFLENVLAGRPCEIHGDGQQTRDFIHVSDVVEALMKADVSKDTQCKLMLLGTGVETSINKLFEEVCHMLGKSVQAESKDALVGDIRRMCYPSLLAQETLGWRPEVDLKLGLKKTFNWLLGSG